MTFWHIAILPSDGFVGGITPQSFGSVIWATAVVTSSSQRFFRELGDIIASVFVWALAVPALTGLPGLGDSYCTGIFRTPCGTFAANIHFFKEKNEITMKLNNE